MSALLTVIPICREDAGRAELLIDLAYQLESRTTKGSCLLCFAPEVHQEQRDKLKIAAELAFKSVDIFPIKQLVTAGPEKGAAIAAMFYVIAQHIQTTYKSPWLWLEPDCMPMKAGWRESLEQAYEASPKKYLCRKMQAGTEFFVARVGIYSPDCIVDIMAANAAQVFFHGSIANKVAVSPLFQETSIVSESDISKVRQDAVLVHSDKQGVLADYVRENNNGQVSMEQIAKEVEDETNRAKQWHGLPSNEALGLTPIGLGGAQPISHISTHQEPDPTMEFPKGTVVASNGHKRRGRPPKAKPVVAPA